MDLSAISKIKGIKFPEFASVPIQKPEPPNKDISIFAGLIKPQEQKGFLA